MAAIREINLGVSQLEEVVQTNAAASHELSATADGLASQASTLQDQVEFFQIDTTASNGQMGRGGTGAVVRSLSGAAGRAQSTPVRPLSHAPRRAIQATRPDGLRGGAGAAALPNSPPALPGHHGNSGAASPGASSNSGGTTPRGGVIVSLDNDDDNFERFS